MAGRLTDDGTLGTIICCPKCGEKKRFTFAVAEAAAVKAAAVKAAAIWVAKAAAIWAAKVTEAAAAEAAAMVDIDVEQTDEKWGRDYNTFVMECIEEFDANHECKEDDL